MHPEASIRPLTTPTRVRSRTKLRCIVIDGDVKSSVAHYPHAMGLPRVVAGELPANSDCLDCGRRQPRQHVPALSHPDESTRVTQRGNPACRHTALPQPESGDESAALSSQCCEETHRGRMPFDTGTCADQTRVVETP